MCVHSRQQYPSLIYPSEVEDSNGRLLVFPQMLAQGTLTEEEGSVQLTSSLRKVVLLKRKNIVSVSKAADPN